MKHLRRLFLLMLLLIFSVNTVFADYTEGYFKYILDDDVVSITEYFGSESTVTVPSMLAGYPVCAVKADSFAKNRKVETVILPSSISKVEEGSFNTSQNIVFEKQDADTDDKKQVENSSEEIIESVLLYDDNGQPEISISGSNGDEVSSDILSNEDGPKIMDVHEITGPRESDNDNDVGEKAIPTVLIICICFVIISLLLVFIIKRKNKK